ncbi:hypothetical protein A3N37_02025 [Enterobacter ludwigii]|nr:hypothetical protein A3N37_02025 [Enterobacter ludwigii]
MMTISGCTGGIARNHRQHGAAQAVRGHRRPPGRQRAPHAQPLTARTPWYIQKNSKTAYPTLTKAPTGKRSTQGRRAGSVRDEDGWLASSIRDKQIKNKSAHIKDLLTQPNAFIGSQVGQYFIKSAM